MNFLILSETKHINMISFLKKRGNVKWESDKIVEVQAIFPDEAFNKEFAMFMAANQKQIFFFKI